MTPRVAVALSTSGLQGSVALAVDGEIVGTHFIEEGFVHGREIVRALDEVLGSRELGPRDVELVCVDVGPGSFTGMRVGVTTAKTLAYAAGAKTVGVAAPDATVRNVEGSAELPRTVLIDAKRSEVVLVEYRVEGNATIRTGDMRIVAIDSLEETLAERSILLGDGLAAIRDELLERRDDLTIAPEADWLPKADQVLRLGLDESAEDRFTAAEDLNPLYVRSSEPIVRRSTKARNPR